MTDGILSIEQVAEQTPWSKTTLYRVAPQEDSPFHKQGGRWVTTESDLLAWVREGPKPRSRNSESPMPPPRSQRRSSFAAKVEHFEKEVA